MTKFDYTIKDELGIHARPAGELVKVAASFPCNIQIEKDGKAVDAKRILGIMGLGVKCGMTISILCDGEKEEEAAAALKEVLQAQL